MKQLSSSGESYSKDEGVYSIIYGRGKVVAAENQEGDTDEDEIY